MSNADTVASAGPDPAERSAKGAAERATTQPLRQDNGAITKDTAHKIVAQILREAEDRDDDFALTLAIVDALWAAGLGDYSDGSGGAL